MTGVDQFRYETWELEAMVRAIEPPQTFLTRMFFPGTRQSDAATIEWDIVEGGQRLAPFVSPYVQGKPIRSRGHVTATLKPAYVKPSKTLTPQDGYVRVPGERYGGQMTARERIDRKLAEQLILHEQMLDNRFEWMAASALVNGSIVISGEDYPAVTVDFGQNSNLRKTISSGVQWDETNGVPLEDIETVALDVRAKSYGAVVSDIVMDGTAWGLFRKKMVANVQFDTQQRLGSSFAETGPRASIDGERVGRLAGRFDIWVYDGGYEDDEGATKKFLPDYTVILAATRAIEGQKYYGAIQDLDAGLVPMRMFHKTKTEFDPSGVTLLSQSAPALAPRRRNAYAKILVKS